MLAILGFIVLVVVGVAALIISGFAFISSSLFGGVEWPPVIIFGAIGAFLLWLSGVYSPFHLTFIGG